MVLLIGIVLILGFATMVVLDSQCSQFAMFDAGSVTSGRLRGGDYLHPSRSRSASMCATWWRPCQA